MKQIIIRRNPFVMLRQIIILEIAIGILYLIPALLEKREIISMTTIRFYSDYYFVIAMVFLQIFIVSLVFIRWYRTQYILTKSKIVLQNNFIRNQEENHKLENIYSITLSQGFLNKVTNSGRLTAKDKAGNELFVLKDIPDPAYHLSLMEDTADKKKGVGAYTNKDLKNLLKNGENQHVEFKSTFLWDKKKKEASKKIQHSVMKTIAGFMNTLGGSLVIGVNDKKEILGLEDDIRNLKKKNLDGFENFLNLVFTNMIGLEFRNYIEVNFERVKGKDICIINVKPSNKPAYIKNKKDEEFYIRAGNATHPLRISEATRYIEERFGKQEKNNSPLQ
jgi:hypothetical protein